MNLSVGWVHSTVGIISSTTGRVKRISISGASPVRPHPEENFIIEHRALSRAAETEKAMLKKAKEKTLVNQIDALVEPIRNAMDKTNSAGRAAIMALVIQRLTR